MIIENTADSNIIVPGVTSTAEYQEKSKSTHA